MNGAVRALPADHVQNGFFGQHILSVRQFDRDKLQYIYRVADEMRSLVKRFGKANLLDGKILANLFYEPSTRTSSSFQAAMLRLGGRSISINEVHYSSVTKGESLPDTVRTLESYCDLTVLRHPQKGASAAGRPLRAQAADQRRRRHRRAPHPGPARHLYHRGRPQAPGRAQGGHDGRPEIRAHGPLADPPALPL